MAAYSYFLQFPVLLRICVARECLYWRQRLSKGMAKGETLEQFGLPCQYWSYTNWNVKCQALHTDIYVQVELQENDFFIFFF
jgi:hypothetical protein